MREEYNIRDKTIGEFFDEICQKYDDICRIEKIRGIIIGLHPVTKEKMSLRIELMEGDFE